ncbi:MAG TPA: multiheme c-type cytochrome [Myxococcota bacterium]
MTDRSAPASTRRPYVPVVGKRLGRLLALVFALFSLLAVDSVYLASVTALGTRFQNWFYLIMFGLHLVLGLALIGPVLVFGAVHIARAWRRPNRRAIRAGLGLFAVANLVFLSGLVLTRVDLGGVRFELNQPAARAGAYWIHVLGPLVAAWLFVLHRLAGRRIRWRVGASWAALAALFAGGMLLLHAQDPRAWDLVGPESGERYFYPSLARTSTGNFIPAEVLQNDAYCRECHTDIHEGWLHSVHRLSSFSNPPYLFSVQETRRALLARDGDVHAARFCAGCHDPVPFFSGAFDDARFDDPDFDLASDPTAGAGITCTVCHSISHINSVRGNADYTIDEPVHYPFASSEQPALRWINRQLVKAKPEFHKATFLKPLHRSTEFCGTCHKVHLPPELNAYKWLRGQNHYDAFWLSGVSGYGIASFYYPPKAVPNCQGCHMSLIEVSDAPNFSAVVRDASGVRKTLDHRFPAANTALPHLLRDMLPDADAAIAARRDFLEGALRLDLFGVKAGGRIDGELVAPLRPQVPMLVPGETVLIEAVIRTLELGHVFTQGTADSNEVWTEVRVTSGGRVIGRSGGLDPVDRAVDPWSHFVNAFVIDREGSRINRRNAQDIFVALYDNQIPPGAADVVHYRLTVPRDVSAPVEVSVKLQYRKFDTEYMRLVEGDPDYVNDLPITTIAEDTIVFPVAGGAQRPANADSPVEAWERWNDYGIALLRKGRLGELRQAAQAFEEVERLGRADGPLNLARVYLKEGRVQADAQEALARAGRAEPPANEWSLLWFGAQVAAANGDFDRAIGNLQRILRGGFAQAAGRNFDFSKDYTVHDALASALYQKGLQEQGEARRRSMEAARDAFLQALAYDPENLAAHWGLKLVYADLGDAEGERRHAALHAYYKPDDNAADHAVARARRRYPAADTASEAVVIYDLQRPGAYDLDPAEARVAQRDD